MRRTNLRRLAMLMLTLTLVSTSLMGNTLARYTSEFSGEGTAQVAKWAFRISGTEATENKQISVPITAAYYQDKVFGQKVTVDDQWVNQQDGNRIAPGTYGVIPIQLNNKSEVDAEVTGYFTVTNVPNDMKFYMIHVSGTEKKWDGSRPAVKDSDLITPFNDGGTKKWSLDGKIKDMPLNTDARYRIVWEWPYESQSNITAKDSADMQIEDAGQMSVTLNITASQAKPEAAN